MGQFLDQNSLEILHRDSSLKTIVTHRDGAVAIQPIFFAQKAEKLLGEWHNHKPVLGRCGNSFKIELVLVL